MNVHILGRLLAKYGEESIQFVNEDIKRDAWDMDSTFYRCENIQENQEDCKNETSPLSIIVDGHSNFTLDENNNLMRYNEHGEAIRVCDDENAIDRNQEEEDDEKMQILSDGQDDDFNQSIFDPSEWVELSLEEEMGQYQFENKQQFADEYFNFNY